MMITLKEIWREVQESNTYATTKRVNALCLIHIRALRLDRTERELKSALFVIVFPHLEVMHSTLNL